MSITSQEIRLANVTETQADVVDAEGLYVGRVVLERSGKWSCTTGHGSELGTWFDTRDEAVAYLVQNERPGK